MLDAEATDDPISSSAAVVASFFIIFTRTVHSAFFMADESSQKQEGDGGEEQGETRNDVVVKIGLVGDAQVIGIILMFMAFVDIANFSLICVGR